MRQNGPDMFATKLCGRLLERCVYLILKCGWVLFSLLVSLYNRKRKQEDDSETDL